jgi:hypothetical protein
MSIVFLSVWCASCRAGFRKRQSLLRHHKKTGCRGSYQQDNLLISSHVQGPIALINSGGRSELKRVPHSLIASILDESLGTTILTSSVSGTTLCEILKQEKTGITSSFSILDLPGDSGLELWSRNNVADFILDLSVATIPIQLVAGAKFGIQAVFMKSEPQTFANHLEYWNP